MKLHLAILGTIFVVLCTEKGDKGTSYKGLIFPRGHKLLISNDQMKSHLAICGKVPGQKHKMSDWNIKTGWYQAE